MTTHKTVAKSLINSAGVPLQSIQVNAPPNYPDSGTAYAGYARVLIGTTWSLKPQFPFFYSKLWGGVQGATDIQFFDKPGYTLFISRAIVLWGESNINNDGIDETQGFDINPYETTSNSPYRERKLQKNLPAKMVDFFPPLRFVDQAWLMQTALTSATVFYSLILYGWYEQNV
jgi:hypothetical protein